MNTTIPDPIELRYVLDYETGLDNLRAGDRILITEVMGTKPGFEQGGIYRVRGTYALGSADAATLALNITAAEAGEGCSAGNDRGARPIQRGTGTFELLAPIPYAGHPHVSFYVDGRNAGGVYFGKGEFLKR